MIDDSTFRGDFFFCRSFKKRYHRQHGEYILANDHAAGFLVGESRIKSKALAGKKLY
jgi:hypothetical protein